MSIGALKRQTTNFLFNIVNFNFARWHGYEHENWDLLDAILSVYVASGGLKGTWKNSTIYSANDRVIDTADSTLWLALIGHTSAAEPTTFAADRIANPTYWRSITYDPQHRGAWTTATVYGVSDFVTDGNRYGIVQDDYQSGASYDADVAANHIETLIDVSTAPDMTAETAARIAADTTLQTNINTVQTNLNTEATTRGNADTTLQTNINAKANKAGDTFTGDVVIQDSDLEWKVATGGTVNKKRYQSWAGSDNFWYLYAINDAGALTRMLLKIGHDGGIIPNQWTTAQRPASPLARVPIRLNPSLVRRRSIVATNQAGKIFKVVPSDTSGSVTVAFRTKPENFEEEGDYIDMDEDLIILGTAYDYLNGIGTNPEEEAKLLQFFNNRLKTLKGGIEFGELHTGAYDASYISNEWQELN